MLAVYTHEIAFFLIYKFIWCIINRSAFIECVNAIQVYDTLCALLANQLSSVCFGFDNAQECQLCSDEAERLLGLCSNYWCRPPSYNPLTKWLWDRLQ